MGSAKKNLKATKKFEKKHLKGVLERRKSVAKIKQRQQLKEKKKTKRAQDDEFYKGPAGDGNDDKKKPGAKASEMSVDDFFKGGFEILDGKASKTAPKLGKRKRDEAKPREDEASEESDSDLDISDNDEPVDDSEPDAGDASSDEEDLGMSKSAMEALAEKDPEFYKFLKENDPEALDFDENADLAELDELSAGSDEEEDEEQPKKKKQKKDKKAAKEEEEEKADDRELTQAMVSRWRASIEQTHSLRAARQVAIAFRCAAHLSEADDENPQRYAITSPEVFNDIVVTALKGIPAVLQHHVPVKESAAGKVYVQTEGKKFKVLSMLIKSFAASVIRLLSTLSDDATLKLTLSSLQPLLPYLLSFRKLLKMLIKTVVAFWSQSASSDSTRITAFLVIRRLVVVGDKGVREVVLKAAYQGLVQGSRLTNANTIQGIHLMKNSAAELWGLDQNLGYTTAFTSIRQLAIHLRNSIVNNKNDAFRAIYNWQYVHSLDFWSCVLAEHCSPLKQAEAGKESPLKPLIYPLVQVTLGAMRLIPTALYFPLRFHLVRSLLRLSRATDTYIPLAAPLLEVLDSAEMKKAPKSSTLKPLDFAVAYKAPKTYLRTRVYQDGVGEQLVELLSEFFVLWARSIAFPEFALPSIVRIKRWLKEGRKQQARQGHKPHGKHPKGRGPHGGSRNGKLAAALALLVQKLEANARFVEERRARVDFAPKDRAQVDAFLKDFEWEKTPLGAYVVSQRAIREERKKQVEEARREEERKRREEEKEALQNGEDDGESGEEDDDDDEDEEMADGVDNSDDEEEEEEEEEEDEEEEESE
ncbi:hypothetical protein VTJ83DRAFT_375 [Remersonia thermophila]|uniref:Nucleolar complex protein 2 n=1 Tax=Remersonia thermophila TaxID=72144 RepID=A0ABR4DN95_9PEZI